MSIEKLSESKVELWGGDNDFLVGQLTSGGGAGEE